MGGVEQVFSVDDHVNEAWLVGYAERAAWDRRSPKR